MTDSLRAYLVLFFGVLCIGFSAIFVKWAAAPGAVTGFYRMAVTTIVLAIPFLRRHAGRQNSGQLPRRELLIALLGGAFFAGDLIFWNTGVLISGATNPTLMANTAPLWVGLGAVIFFRERLPPLFWIGLLLAMSGAGLILGLDVLAGFSLGLGTTFGLISGAFYGTYLLLTQMGRRRLDALSYIWVATVSASIILFFSALALGQPLTGYSPFTYLNFLALGLIAQVMGQFSFSYSLGHLPASVVAPAGLGQPVVTALLAWPLFGEGLSPLQALGGLALLGGVYVVHRSRLARQPGSSL